MESEERYRITFDEIPDMVFELAFDGTVIYANKSSSKKLGYSLDRLGKINVNELVDKDSLDDALSRIKEMFETKETSFNEYNLITSDGKVIPVESSTKFIEGKDKSITIIGVARDITERKQIEEALAGAVEKWEETFDAVDDMIAIIDDERNILRANRAMREVFGDRNIEEKKCYELFHGTDEPIPLCPCTRSFETGEFEHLELVEPHLDNRVFDIFTYPIGSEEGDAKKVVHVARDITDRKRAEDKLKLYADNLERANEDVKNFSYIVSHDLKAPLINIKGYSERVNSAFEEISRFLTPLQNQLDESEKERFSSLVEEDVPKYMEFINLSTNRIGTLSNAILKLSRLGRKELTLNTIEMDKAVSSSIHNLAHKIEEKGTTIDVMKLNDIVADWNSMQTIIDNLISNAVNYLDPERVGEIEIWAVEGKDETTFYIKDNGMGIEENDKERIFNIFQRSGKQDVSGEGMGLAYVKTLVERHNGRIWCESELGVGSTFIFTISKHLGSGQVDE